MIVFFDCLGVLLLVAIVITVLFEITIWGICRRLRQAADQYEIGDVYSRKCPGNAWVLRMIAFALDGKDQPL